MLVVLYITVLGISCLEVTAIRFLVHDAAALNSSIPFALMFSLVRKINTMSHFFNIPGMQIAKQGVTGYVSSPCLGRTFQYVVIQQVAQTLRRCETGTFRIPLHISNGAIETMNSLFAGRHLALNCFAAAPQKLRGENQKN
jgi:hypothetical protein